MLNLIHQITVIVLGIQQFNIYIKKDKLMAYLEELLPEFRKGAKIRMKDWKKGTYICVKDGDIIDENGVYSTDFYDGYLISEDWEFYQETIDWNYIIENKCLCWFWDEREEYKLAGYLKDYDSYENQFYQYTGENVAQTAFNNCHPVGKNEVTFYEDRKDD